MPGSVLDRRYYELCVLSELRGRLRAGDVWVVGSRRYRSFEEGLTTRAVRSCTRPLSTKRSDIAGDELFYVRF